MIYYLNVKHLTCKWCGVAYYNSSTHDARNDTHKCNYIFMRQLTEFGEGVIG